MIRLARAGRRPGNSTRPLRRAWPAEAGFVGRPRSASIRPRWRRLPSPTRSVVPADRSATSMWSCSERARRPKDSSGFSKPSRARACVVLARTPERGEALVAGATGSSAAWDALPAALAQADVVFAATAAIEPVLSCSMLAAALDSRRSRSIVVLDLAVPRNVDPLARDLRGVKLFDLDDLRLQHCPAAVGSAPALAEAEALVRTELSQFGKMLRAGRRPLTWRSCTGWANGWHRRKPIARWRSLARCPSDRRMSCARWRSGW